MRRASVDGVIMRAASGGQLGQAFLDVLAQGLTRRQAGGQARHRRVQVRVFGDDLSSV